ncbi:hypothetical protein CCB80_10490 [Armatimonadetes bacterium Uphvl-Ar1]|nr:hypothetical protein CCB80_10490 [Armatimonadetes bacterium Uphvl-Ar1]
MKIHLVGRYDGGLIHGGAEVQLETTKRLLVQSGHDVKVLSPEVKDWPDLFHFFGSNDYYWSLAQLCLEKHIPYVVSAIWYVPGNPTELKIKRTKATIEQRYPRKTRKLLQNANRVLIPSQDIAQRLKTYFDVDPPKCRVVPSGTCTSDFGFNQEEAMRRKYNINGEFILAVGNFLDRKNQLNLIRAVQNTQHQIVFAGGPSDQPYYNMCRELAQEVDPKSERFKFLGEVPHQDLGGLLRASKLFALPSLLEDFLIAGVEAGALGKPLVLSNSWNANEIYGEYAELPDPNLPKQILKSIETAWQKSDNPAQAAWFLERYSERALLTRYEEIYSSIL